MPFSSFTKQRRHLHITSNVEWIGLNATHLKALQSRLSCLAEKQCNLDSRSFDIIFVVSGYVAIGRRFLCDLFGIGHTWNNNWKRQQQVNEDDVMMCGSDAQYFVLQFIRRNHSQWHRSRMDSIDSCQSTGNEWHGMGNTFFEIQ